MFRNADVLDFQAVLETEVKTDRENLRVLIEIRGDCELQQVTSVVAAKIKTTFEISPAVEVLCARQPGGGIRTQPKGAAVRRPTRVKPRLQAICRRRSLSSSRRRRSKLRGQVRIADIA